MSGKTAKVPAVAGQNPSKTQVASAAAKVPVETATTETPKRKRSEELVSMTVHKEFRLQNDDSTFTEYGLGTQDMPASHADHWYTKLHADRNDD